MRDAFIRAFKSWLAAGGKGWILLKITLPLASLGSLSSSSRDLVCGSREEQATEGWRKRMQVRVKHSPENIGILIVHTIRGGEDCNARESYV